MANVLSKGDIVDGKYRVTGQIHGGKMSDVYVVKHVDYPFSYILKVTLPADELPEDDVDSPAGTIAQIDPLKRTLDEANMMARFNYPTIVKPIDVIEGIKGRYHGILMERVGDGSRFEDLRGYSIMDPIKQLKSKRNLLDKVTLYDLLIQLEETIYHLIDNGIVHKDIKPPNLIVDSGTTIKLIDFGYACPVDEPNNFFANRQYAPPEFYRGEIHRYSDLWSLGLILFEYVMGEPIFTEDKEEMARLMTRISTKDGIRRTGGELDMRMLGSKYKPVKVRDFLGWYVTDEEFRHFFDRGIQFPDTDLLNDPLQYVTMHEYRNKISTFLEHNPKTRMRYEEGKRKNVAEQIGIRIPVVED